MPPKRDVNLFILHAGGRGVCGDVAAQGLILGSASVCVSVCGLVCPGWGLVGGRSSNFGARTGPFDAEQRDLQKVKAKWGLILWFCSGFGWVLWEKVVSGPLGVQSLKPHGSTPI